MPISREPSGGAELDLLLFRNGKRLGFEFKCSDAPTLTKSMHIVLADLVLHRLFVVYPGKDRYPLHEKMEALQYRSTAVGGEPMNPRVKTVHPNPDYSLNLIFDNGETRRFDVTPYLEKGIFRELREMRNFNSVKVFLGSVQWRGGQDLCSDTLYMDSKPISENSGV
jgi:hypothetical protein